MAGTHKKAMHESMRVKLNVQWRLKNVGDVRNLEHLLRRAIGNEKSQPKKRNYVRYYQRSMGVQALTTTSCEW